MRYVGHADLVTTLRYTHLVLEHLRIVVEHCRGGESTRDRAHTKNDRLQGTFPRRSIRRTIREGLSRCRAREPH